MRLMMRMLAVAAIVLCCPPLQAACGNTTFKPISPFVPSGETHNALYLTDPSGQQRAVFDLVWGGVLASLKYNNVEHVWGHATGGMVQPAWHTYPTSVSYNPTPAGDGGAGNRGTPVLGARCITGNRLMIMSGTTDYSVGGSGHVVAETVKNGAIVPGMYATPYTVTTFASFVVNPLGTPAYYLRLEHTIKNIHPTENFAWGFELAGYVPYSFSHTVRYPANCIDATSNCTSSITPRLLAGLYPNASFTNGTAFFVSPQASYPGTQDNFASFGIDTVNQNQAAHMFAAQLTIPPSTPRQVNWYVMPGNWSTALSFAQSQ